MMKMMIFLSLLTGASLAQAGFKDVNCRGLSIKYTGRDDNGSFTADIKTDLLGDLKCLATESPLKNINIVVLSCVKGSQQFIAVTSENGSVVNVHPVEYGGLLSALKAENCH